MAQFYTSPILDSQSVKNLSAVKLYYIPDDGKPVDLFPSLKNPLYLVDTDLPEIRFDVKADDIWGNSSDMFGKALRMGIQGFASSDFGRSILGNWTGFSGTIDLRSKFLFTGSTPQEFNINCMLINKYGWDVSIAPVLKSISDFVLPSTVKDVDGNEITIGKKLVEKYLPDAGKDFPDEGFGKDLGTLFKFLTMGLQEFRDWIGDAHLLNIPEQYQRLDNSANTAYLEIGRLKVPNVFITGVGISIPKTYMVNEDGGHEPDHVKIRFSFKTLRQTTTSTFKF